MTLNGWEQIAFFLGAVVLLTVPAGGFLFRVLETGRHPLRRPLGWLERALYRLCDVDGREQSWQEYCKALLAK